jgi:hypothetical protein
LPTSTPKPNSTDNLNDRIGYIVSYIPIGFLGLGFIFGFFYNTIRDYLNKRKVYTIEISYPEGETVNVRLISPSSLQTECAVCLQKFAFTQICCSLPRIHTFCEECMSECN